MQPEARVRIIAWISWLTGRGQQSDSYIAGSNHAMTLARMRVAGFYLGVAHKLGHFRQFLAESYPPI